MKLSACMIMRDAEQDLPDALGSLAGNADEIVVVDTGSSDGSVEAARRYTDKVYSFPWQEDFAAARNYCMDRATGDWIFFLDSDEYLTRETRGNLRRLMAGIAAQGLDYAEVRRENVDENHERLPREGDFALRLFRRDPKRRYRDPIHEYLVCDGEEKPGKCMIPPRELCIHHKGYSPARIHEKYLRNVRILERMQERGEKKRFRDYYLAGLYFSEKEYAKALPHARRAVEEGDLPDYDSFTPWRIWFDCLKALGEAAEEQERVLRLGMEKCPKMPDFYFHYGTMLMNRGDFAGAWGYLAKGERLMDSFAADCPREQNPMERIRNELYGLMSETCLRLGREDAARRYAGLKWKVELGLEDGPAFSCSAYIPPKSRMVVEFGCGRGETGRAFRLIQPECCYLGMDTDEAALMEAGKYLSAVSWELPQTMDFARHGIRQADCIIYQDRALSGLTAGHLRRHAEHLAPDGQMVFVLENEGYFRHVMNALAGRAGLPRGGFDLEKLQDIIGKAGLKIFSVIPLYDAADEAEMKSQEVQALRQAVEAWSKRDASVKGADLRACRYVLRVAREFPKKGFFLQTMMGETVATARIRIGEPHAFLQTFPGIACYAEAKTADLGRGRRFARKVLLRQRLHYPDMDTGLSQISTIRRAGYLISYELDDSPVRWKEAHEKTGFLDFVGSHVIQASTQPLAEVLRQYNPHVVVFRNELRELPPQRTYDEAAPITVFFGALNREEEWADIMPVLNEAAAKYGKGLRFRVLADRPFFEALRTEHKEFIGSAAYFGGKFVPYEVYTKVLHSADISLLPLTDNEFNRAKSDLKFIESAGHGAVVLASPTVYAATVRDGRTGFLYHSPREFRARFMMLMEDRARLRETAEAAYDYVRRNRLLCQHYEERRAFYDEMLDRKEELDRELDERLEKLKKSI